MRRSRSSAAVLFFSLAVGATTNAQAQSTPTVEGGAFLLLPLGARATALGQAGAADGGTTEALYWNPAGLETVKRSEGAIHYFNRGLFGTGTSIAFAIPKAGFGTFAAAAYLVEYGSLDIQPGPGQPIGQILPRNVELSAAYATDIAFGVSAGIAYKLVQFRIDCSGDCSSFPPSVGTSHAVDLGLRYVVPSMPVTLGITLRHLGFKLQVNNSAQADPLPTRLAFGFAAQILRPPPGADRVDLRVLGDFLVVVGRGGEPVAPLLGADIGVRELVRLRLGYAGIGGSSSGPAIGLGVKIGRVAMDIARTFQAEGDLGEREPMHLSLRLAL